MSRDYHSYYSSYTKEELQKEKEKYEKIIEDQTIIWEATNLAGSICLTVFGIIFLFILVGIPLLVFGIKGIVEKSRMRNRANIAIWDARARLLAIEDNFVHAGSKKEAIEAEAIDIA